MKNLLKGIMALTIMCFAAAPVLAFPGRKRQSLGCSANQIIIRTRRNCWLS